MIAVGLVGARGYVGRELIRLLDRDERFALSFASSRALAGRAVGDMPGIGKLSRFGDLQAEDLSPEDAAGRGADLVVLGLPNGLSEPYVRAIDARSPETLVIDLSADHRHRDGWTYGAPELFGEKIAKARRIANPGCYATAANLALAPLADGIDGPVSVFGVSGFSGAGTTPGDKNDPERLEANLMPYGFGGHGHQAEIARTVGADIVFMPHVAPFFRGLMVTLSVPVREGLGPDGAFLRLSEHYAGARRVDVQRALPELRTAAGSDRCTIGGFAMSEGSSVLTYASALDNLLKGAASQALENAIIALDLA